MCFILLNSSVLNSSIYETGYGRALWDEFKSVYFTQLYFTYHTYETGYGRTHWDEFKMAYHGEMEEQHMHGEGTFFFANGDMLEGSFEGHKPKGPGVLTELKTGKRYSVEYDGSKKLSEGAVPVVKTLFEQPLQVFVLVLYILYVLYV